MRGLLLIPLALAWFALLPTSQAVDPPPDGGYRNQNTAEGTDALFSLTTGTENTAIGFDALFNLTTGFNNTAVGQSALYYNTTGSDNTANGALALFSNTEGFDNTGTGVDALYYNTTGALNTATGVDALFFNTTGDSNTATGLQALVSNTTGSNNTAYGYQALHQNTIGGYNIALGHNAGFNLTIGSNNIEIGNNGVAGEANKIRIGTKGTHNNTFIAGISGVTVARGVGVIIDTNGHLGTVVSSARFKDAIKPMDKVSESILALKPVTFRYKHELDPEELDPEGSPQFGLVAEEVEKVNPDLVARDDKGKPYTVRYEAVNAMLLNEFLKEHHKVETQAKINQNQEATIAQLKSALEQQQKEFKTTMREERKEIQALAVALKEQAAQIHKVAGVKRIEARVSGSELIADN